MEKIKDIFLKIDFCLGSNFSHRIDKFSFGENCDLVHNALNHEFKVTKLRKLIKLTKIINKIFNFHASFMI